MIEDMIVLSPKGVGAEASVGEDIDIDSLPVVTPPKEEVKEEVVAEEPEVEKPKEEVGDKDLPF